MTAFPTETYKGPNRRHSRFRDTYRYLNALYYLVISCRDQLERKLADDLKNPGLAVGIVTHAISNTQFQGVFVHQKDAKEMATNFDSFIATFNKQTIVSAYRVIATYLSDNLLELSDNNLITLEPEQLRRLTEGFMSSKKLGDLYEGIGIPIAINDHEQVLIEELVATRNVIEHNDGKVNEEYLRITKSTLQTGDEAPSGTREVGEALAIAEWLADSVNKRCLEQWPILAT